MVWRAWGRLAHFADGEALRDVIAALAGPWKDPGVTRVVGIESRGFLLGAAAAVELRVGFCGDPQGRRRMLPGPKVTTASAADYRGDQPELRMQAILDHHDRVLLVDDWAERGSQALATAEWVARCGAHLLGLSVLVHELSDESRARLGRFTALVTVDDLGADTQPASS